MGKESVDERLDIISKSVTDLANVVLDVVNRVYKEGDMYGEKEEYEFTEEGPVGDPLDDETMKMEGEEELEDEIMEDEIEMGRHKKSKDTKKGYANTARVKADEEDAPFGEQQDSIKGNEASPAGEIGGAREDETFNAKFSRVLSDIEDLKSSKFSRANAVVPSIGNLQKGRESGTDTGNVMTRDIQEKAKDLSYKQLNEFRMQNGLLPRNIFGG